MTLRPNSILWFARHELRLTWRDFLHMMTAGRKRRGGALLIALIVFALVMHLIAYAMVARQAGIAASPSKLALVVITGTALLSWSAMLSQAMESTTRVFYARADLDLILSSPAASRRLFAVRIAAMALAIALMAMLLASPFIDVLAFAGGWRWLGAYGAAAAAGIAAASIAVALTVALFAAIGPKRTRLVAQIVAAVIGAGFVIGVQVAAILSYGTLSRMQFLESAEIVALAPDANSIFWLPARAVLGEASALVALLAASLLLLAGAIASFAPRFARFATAAASVSESEARRERRAKRFHAPSPGAALRRKEWALLRRDPWLVSQSLMQLLYLLPPALLLWRSFSNGSSALALLVPVLVMASGQLAGGLAWLAVSGEDAPDLIATAPITARRVLAAKIECVLGVIALVFAPFVLALAIAAPWDALVAACGIVIAAASATAIQLFFRVQAKRSHFRRRQTSSRVATFAEAFSSIAWAATGVLAAAGTWLAAPVGGIALAIIGGARLIAPARR